MTDIHQARANAESAITSILQDLEQSTGRKIESVVVDTQIAGDYRVGIFWRPAR